MGEEECGAAQKATAAERESLNELVELIARRWP